MKKRGLGININADVTRNFFSLQPASVVNRNFVKHHVGSSQLSSRSVSGSATPRLDEKYFEQQLKLANLDNVIDDPRELPTSTSQPVNELLLPEPEDEEPQRMDQAISVEVYDNYSFDHDYDHTLPITDVREQIVQTIAANRAVVIQGSTGSGKTTQVPQFILDDYKQKRKYCNILITQPRRIAAISVAKRVSQERNWQLGTLVGYQVARDRKVTEDTRISYMTTGVLLQKLIRNKNLGDYTHIILDEVHERDQDIDFSMLVVRKYLQTVAKHVKIVLMSATVDSSLFSNYFSILINGKQEGAPVISVDGKMYDVVEYYFEDIAGLAEAPQQTIYEPEISSKCYQLCRQLIMALDKDELGENYKDGNLAKSRGTVLCFLPGLPEIINMHKYLDDLERTRKWKIMPLHSQISSKEQVLVFFPAQPYERKIILATNIAESSITVPDIKYVIDFCLTKNNETDRETNYQRLTLQWASKASLTQRKGRAGRVSEGHCFRMISSSFVSQLYDYGMPEMLCAPLEQVVLKVKLLELGPPALILQLAIQPPEIIDIKRTILMLKEVGAITVRQNNIINSLDGDLTFVGRVVGSLPVDVHIGKLLLIGFAFGVLEECLVIGACLSLKSIFSKPFKNDVAAYSNKMHWANFQNSDLLASLSAFLSWKFRKEHSGFGEPEKSWFQKNMLEGRRFYEVDELVKELDSRLRGFNMISYRDIYKRDEISNDDAFILKIAIAAAFYPNYFHTQEVEETEATKTMCGHNPFTTVVVHNAPPTLCHYRAKVAGLFRQCGKGKRMFFENSRAFIEFENESVQSPVTAAVYKAIKLRHLRIPLNILVSKQKDEDFRTSLLNQPYESFNPETGLRTNRVNTELPTSGRRGQPGKLSVTLQGDPKQVKLKESGYIIIIIQEIVNAGHFWATYGDKDTQQAMLQLHNKINSFDGRNLEYMKNRDIKPGSFCLALFDDEFFRAKIVDCAPNLVKVFFLDYGNSVQITDIKQLRYCSDKLLEVPFQAFECYLSEMRPRHGTWTPDAIQRFTELVNPGACALHAKIYSQIHEAYRIELFADDVNINRLLIEEGHAMECEESLPSKTRHVEVEKLNGVSQQKKTKDTVIQDGSRIEEGEEVLKITLRGPFSPFEMSFSGLTAAGHLRAVRVEQDSVNSVVICEEPQDKRPRMLVAAAINVNTAGNTMIARETTYLPNIHGLSSLLPILFAPVAELRLNKEETAITGAICGLGYDDTGASILPDHDVEITFDVELNNDDFSIVNNIRMVINEIIGKEGEKIEHPAHYLANLQQLVRKKLDHLVFPKDRTRTDITTPVHFRHEFQWQKCNSELLMDSGHEELPTHLYAYHKGIFLEKKEAIDPRILEDQKKLTDFQSFGGPSTVAFKNLMVCPTCKVACRHPRGLYLHCETATHRNWVAHYFKMQPIT